MLVIHYGSHWPPISMSSQDAAWAAMTEITCSMMLIWNLSAKYMPHKTLLWKYTIVLITAQKLHTGLCKWYRNLGKTVNGYSYYYQAVSAQWTYSNIFLLLKEAHSNIVPHRNGLRQELCSYFIFGESNIKVLVILKEQQKYNHREVHTHTSGKSIHSSLNLLVHFSYMAITHLHRVSWLRG